MGRRGHIALFLAAGLVSVGLGPSSVRADPRRPATEEGPSLEATLRALESCLGVEQAVMTLGERWEEVLAEADWDRTAPGPRAYADRIAPALRHAFLSRDNPRAGRKLALELLVQLQHRDTGEPLFLRMLEVRSCPADWTALAADGLARLGGDGALESTRAALVASVPEGRAPDEAAWAMCTAVARLSDGEQPVEVQQAVRRLFLFAPQIAVGSCMPLVLALPDARALAERVIRGDDWPEQVQGVDPREERMLGPYGRGAALLALGRIGGDGVYEQLAEALEDRSIRAQPTRDGAIQGLAALGGASARMLLRQLMRDPDRRTPRIAHALLRLGDVQAAGVLREAALDPEAIVEMRVSAANAYTMLAPGRPRLVREWERDLGRSPAIGPPFEAIDARMAEMGQRLVVAERCGDDTQCWAEALSSDDPQIAARAFYQLSRSRLVDDDEAAPLLATAAAGILAMTPPNERHDLVSGAIALLARVDAEHARAHLPVVRRAHMAWEGRTNPMGLPFDIPSALGQLAERIGADD